MVKNSEDGSKGCDESQPWRLREGMSSPERPPVARLSLPVAPWGSRTSPG